MTHNSVEPDNAKWSPDGKFIVFTADVYPDCPAFTEAMSTAGSEADKCNADRDKAAADSKVKAQIWTTCSIATGIISPAKSAAISSSFMSRTQCPQPSCGATSRRTTRTMSRRSRSKAAGADATFRPTRSNWSTPTTPIPFPPSPPARASGPRPDRRDGQAGADLTSAGGNFNPAYSPDGKYIAWRSQARAGYESDKFRLVVYDCTAKTVKDLLPKWDNWVDEFAWGPTSSNAIYFTSGTEGEEPVFEIDGVGLGAGLGRNPFIIQITRSGDYGDLHPTTNGMEVLATRVTVASPREGVILDTPGVGHTLREIAYSGGPKCQKP